MHKFKVGDKVVRLDGTPTALFSKIIGSKKYYIVTYVSDCGRWIQVNGVQHLSDAAPWGAINFELYQEPEDELPPVPASVSYMSFKRDPGNDQRLVLDKDNGDGEGLMYIGVIPGKGSNRAKVEIGINIDPDSALQLAHDILRMAMEVRRKERAKS